MILLSWTNILSVSNIIVSLIGIITTAIVTYSIAKDRIASEFSKLQLQAENERKQLDRVYLINLKIEESKNIIYSLDILSNIQLSVLHLYRKSKVKDDKSEKLKDEINKAFSDLTVTINYFPELKKQFEEIKTKYNEITHEILTKKYAKEELSIELVKNDSLELVFKVSDIKKSVGTKIEQLVLEMEKNYR